MLSEVMLPPPMGNPDTQARIDLLTDIDSVDSGDFSDCYEHRKFVQIDVIALRFVVLDDF